LKTPKYPKKIKNVPSYWIDFSKGFDRQIVFIRRDILGKPSEWEIIAEIPYMTKDALDKAISRAYEIVKELEEGRLKVKDLKHNYNKST
jgi:hypothetical protein